MDEEQLKILYSNYGKGKGFTDYGEFKSLMDNDDSRKIFFESSNEEMGFKDFGEFDSLLGKKKELPIPVGGQRSNNGILPSSQSKLPSTFPISNISNKNVVGQEWALNNEPYNVPIPKQQMDKEGNYQFNYGGKDYTLGHDKKLYQDIKGTKTLVKDYTNSVKGDYFEVFPNSGIIFSDPFGLEYDPKFAKEHGNGLKPEVKASGYKQTPKGNESIHDFYNIKSYATAPHHERVVDSAYRTILKIPTLSAESINDYMKQNSGADKVPFSGEDIINVANKYNVDPAAIMAIIQVDSSFGTKGKAVRTKNAGNVGNTDSGASNYFKTWQEGLDAVGRQLSKRKIKDNEVVSKIGGESTPQLPLTSQSRLGEKPKAKPKSQPKTDLLGKPISQENVKTYSPFTSTVEELSQYFHDEYIGKITKSMLNKNTRYNYLKTKKEAYDMGYSDDKSLNGKTAEQKYFDDRETYLVDKYLDQNDKEEVQALVKFKDLRKLGKEKEANVELEKYLNARSAYRKNIDNQIVEIKATLPNITDPTEKALAERDIQELEILKKPVYNPEQALVNFNKENSDEISNVAKPSESPKEKLRKYTNALYTSVLTRREELGLTDDMNGLQRFMAERDILSNVEGERFTQKKQELDDLHADELKLRNATKIYELNRTPYEKDNALGVFAKIYQSEILPYKKGVTGVDNVIAGNIQTIINDAEIVDSATKEQLALAKQYDKSYEFLSPKWAAQTIAPTAAIISEMIPAVIATEGIAGLAGLGKLNRAINLLAEEGKLTEAGAAYFNSIQNSKIGMGLLKASASGVKYGIESKALSILAPQIKDEMGFASGLFAGAGGSALGSLTGKALEGSIKSIARLFGNKSTDAIRAIESYGTMIAKAKDFSNKVVGETAEEYLEQIAGIYKQSENYNNFITELRKHYETTDAIEEFATIFIMSVGAPAGSTLGRGLLQSSTKLYNNLNRAERKVADQIADELHTEERTAQSNAINSVVSPQNQVTQEDLIIAPQEITTEPTSTEGVEAISVEEQQAIDEAIPNLTEPLKKEIKGLTTIENLMSEGVLEYVDEQTGEPCIKHGIRGNSFKRGSEWEIVKDLKGYKTHEQGGVDLTIGSDGIKIKNGKTDYYAKNGLLMPNN